MPYLRHALNLFLLLAVLALAIPSDFSQDNTKSDDTTSQSDRSDDQSSDQITLSDFIFEHTAILHSQLLREIRPELISQTAENFNPAQFSRQSSFLPQIFISGGGLMPRAPALA